MYEHLAISNVYIQIESSTFPLALETEHLGPCGCRGQDPAAGLWGCRGIRRLVSTEGCEAWVPLMGQWMKLADVGKHVKQ